jgi:DNA-binding CsgD family transcriptional regulator
LTTDSDALQALPGFLSLLSQSNSPDDIVRSLALGPLRPFHATAAFLASFDGVKIRLIGSYGYPPEIPTRYEIMAAAHDWPINRAISLNQLITVSFSKFFSEYPSVEIDRPIWEPFFATAKKDGLLVFIPISYRGMVRGVFGFAAVDSPLGGVTESSFFQGLTAAFCLWMHGNLDMTSTGSSDPFTQELPLLLTPRQVEILQLVEEGKSNSVIARLLGYSISTVKLDLNRAMRMLRTQERVAAAARARELQLLPANARQPAL